MSAKAARISGNECFIALLFLLECKDTAFLGKSKNLTSDGIPFKQYHITIH